MSKRLLNKLPKKEMIRCEACGQLHPLEECEIIVIKIVKGKNCDLNSLVKPHALCPTVFAAPPPTFTPPPQLFTPPPPSTTAETPPWDANGMFPEGTKVIRNNDGSVTIFPPEKPETAAAPVQQAPKRKILPPGIEAFMIAPDDPRFESKGAKETRKV